MEVKKQNESTIILGKRVRKQVNLKEDLSSDTEAEEPILKNDVTNIGRQTV
jgi:hypothetical protein